jgi:hypothetical protein
MTRPHKTPKTAWLGPRAEWIDWFALCTVLALTALPHYALLRLPVSTYTVWGPEILSGLLSAISVACIAMRGKSTERILFGLFVIFVFAVYLALSITVLQFSVQSCMSHVRFFLPFIAASLVVNAAWNLRLSLVIKCIALACTASGILAIILNLEFPDFYQTLHVDNEISNSMAKEGRLVWSSASSALVVPLIFVVPMRWILRLPILILVTSAVAMTQSRTLLFGYLGLTLVLITQSSRSPLKTLVFIACVLTSIAVIAYSTLDDQIVMGFTNRFGLNENFNAAINTAIVDGRGELFEYYAGQLQNYRVLGGGFGRPLFIPQDQTPVFTSDVSVLSFYFPMGLIGLCLIFTFWWICWKRIRAASRDPHVHSVAVGLQWVLCIACIVSLNLDIFSRNLFVVLLAFLIAILRSYHFQRCNINSYK